MKAYITTGDDIRQELDVELVIENAYGYHAAKNQKGERLKSLNGEDIRVNNVSRIGIGFLGEVKCLYEFTNY